MYARALWSVRSQRQLILFFMLGFSSAIAFWVGAAFAEGNLSLGLCFAGLLLDYGTPFALLRLMITVNYQHMSERMSGFTALMLAGCLFNFMTSISEPGQKEPPSVRAFVCTGLAIVLAFSLLLIYAVDPTVPGTDAFHLGNYFAVRSGGAGRVGGELGEQQLERQQQVQVQGAVESVMRNRLRTYCWLYAHMPLTISICAHSLALGKLSCVTGLMDSGTRVVLCESAAITLLLLGLLHFLGKARNVRRCVVRCAFAVIVALLPLFGSSVDCQWYLGILAALFFAQVIIDSMRVFAPPDAPDTDPEGVGMLAGSY